MKEDVIVVLHALKKSSHLEPFLFQVETFWVPFPQKVLHGTQKVLPGTKKGVPTVWGQPKKPFGSLFSESVDQYIILEPYDIM